MSGGMVLWIGGIRVCVWWLFCWFECVSVVGGGVGVSGSRIA